MPISDDTTEARDTSEAKDAKDGQLRRSFFSGRHGHPLRPYHAHLFETLLPTLRLDLSQPAPRDLTTLFPHQAKEIRLEIGFGDGGNLVSEAKRLPEVGFIGCDPYRLGVARALASIDRASLNNVRMVPLDAWELLEWLPESSLNGVCLLYPDPWNKRKHRKRRFIQDDTIATFARLMSSGAVLRLATDVEDYGLEMLSCCSRSDAFNSIRKTEQEQRAPWSDFPGTRYEARAKRQGRTPRYLEFVRV